MNGPFVDILHLCEKGGADIKQLLTDGFSWGHVYSNEKYFVLGFETSPGTFFVQLLAGDWRACIADHGHRFDRIEYDRQLRGDPRRRIIELKKLQRHGKRRHTSSSAT